MSYLYWPSGAPGAGISTGPYTYTSNIHINDGTTSVNAESIQNGIGREISLLQNYLSTSKFMSGMAIGTGYFYSIGSSGYPVNNVYIVNLYSYETSTSGAVDTTFKTDFKSDSIYPTNVTLGNNITNCNTIISGWFKGLAFELTSGKLYVSGYWDNTNSNIFDMIGISGNSNSIVISDTPITYLNSNNLDGDLYARRLYINENVSGHINTFYMRDGILGIENYADISTHDDTKKILLSSSFPSGWNPFQYSIPYHSEHQIIFDGTNGHSFGEGDLSLIDRNSLTFSGGTFTNVTFSGLMSTTQDWIKVYEDNPNKKYLTGTEYKDSLYIAQEDWNSGVLNVIKYNYSSGIVGTVKVIELGTTLDNFSGLMTYRNNLYLITSGVQYKFDDTEWTSGNFVNINYNLFTPIMFSGIQGVQTSGINATFNNNIYRPRNSTTYDYEIVNNINNGIISGVIINSGVESFFTYKNLLLAAVSGKLYKTNDYYFNIIERDTYDI